MNTKTIVSSVVLIFTLMFGVFLLQRQADAPPPVVPKTPPARSGGNGGNGVMSKIADRQDVSTFIQLTKINPAFYDTLENKGQYTMLVPTDQAFANTPQYSVPAMTKDATTRTYLLIVHLIPNLITTRDLKEGMTLPTVEGKKLTVTKQNGNWYIDGARIVTPDIHSRNGIVHIIDKVIEPIPYKP